MRLLRKATSLPIQCTASGLEIDGQTLEIFRPNVASVGFEMNLLDILSDCFLLWSD